MGISKNGSRGLIAGLGACFSLANFTDKFYKQAIVLLASSLHLHDKQGIATLFFSLPFVLFSAWAGWIADHYSKRNIIIITKFLEFITLLLGCYALYSVWWGGMLFVVFIMGLQATLFSPALNGSVPENFNILDIPKINSLIKITSTLAILAGISLAGLILDLRPGKIFPTFNINEGEAYGRFLAGVLVIFIAFIGFIISLFLKGKSSSLEKREKSPFPWLGPIDSLKHFFETREDPQLFTVLLAEGFFYGVSVVAVLSVVNMSSDLGLSKTISSFFSSVIMIGVAFGAIFAGRLSVDSWRWLLVPSSIGISIFLALAGATPLLPTGAIQLVWFFIVLLFVGICGGFYLIPLASFIQVRPKDKDKGKIIGVSNFFTFIAIGVWGILFTLISVLPSPIIFIVYSVTTFLFALFFIRRKISSFTSPINNALF